MLSFFRRVMSSWVMLGLLGLLLVAFVVTGIGDPFGGGPSPDSLAKVGSENIRESDFARHFDRFMRRAREQNPALTNEQAARQGAVEQLFEQLVGATALVQFGYDQGLAISDRAVDSEIASIPAFQLAGKFDQATFERVLSEQRLTTAEVREDLRNSAITRQLLGPIAIGAGSAPRTLVEPYAALLLEVRRGSIAVLPATRFAQGPAPTAEQLNSFYRQNLARYTVPERRSLRYALLTKDALAATVQPTEAEVTRYYEEHKEAYGGVETRTLSQVVVADQAAAQRIAARARAGEPFASVAQQAAGYSSEDLALGSQTEQRLAAATNAAVAKAAFAAQTGSIVGPIRSEFGWHVLRIDSITPARGRALDSVRGEIVAALRAEKAEDLLAQKVADIEDALAQGQSLADVAKTHGLTLQATPAVTRTGAAQDPGYRPDTTVRELITKAFEADADDEPIVEELAADRFAILEIGEVTPAAPAPLQQIRPVVAAHWAQFQAMQRAKAAADAITAEVAKGTPLAQALAKRGLPAPQTVEGRRIELGRDGQPVPPPLALLFSLPDGAVRSLAAPGDQGWYVVKVEAVTKGNAQADLNILGGMQSQFARSLPEELAGQFARAVEREVGVERNAEAIAAMRARYLGQGGAGAQ